jgi:hypothetical protein
VFGVGFGLQFAGLGYAEDISDVTAYFEFRQGHNLDGGSSVDIASMSVPIRMITYAFRPLFFHANGLLGLIVSFENLFQASLIFCATYLIMRGKKSQLSRFALLFFTSFTIISWFVLANTTANLGIATRQKWMFLPMLLVIAGSYFFKSRR